MQCLSAFYTPVSKPQNVLDDFYPQERKFAVFGYFHG